MRLGNRGRWLFAGLLGVWGMAAPLLGQSSPLTVVKPAGKEPTLTLGGLLQVQADVGLDSTPATPDRDGIFAGERRGAGVDSQLVAGRFELWAEYLRTDFEPANDIPGPDFVADGGYVQASWFVLPQKLQLVLKQETFDPNGDVSEDETDTTTLGVNYYLKGHDLKLMLDYLRVDAGSLDSQDKVIARL